jgi:GcrA cell cycle regulator
MEWTDRKIDILRERVAAGIKSADIAREFRTTRNSIIGKAHRLGLSWGVKAKEEREVTPPKVRVRSKPKPKPRPYRMRSLMELAPDDCRFIPGHEMHGRIFCAKPVKAGSPYCEEHTERCSGGLR